MRLVRCLVTIATGAKVYKQAAALNLHGISGDAILFEARLANAATAVKSPIVPGADDVIAI
jgi:hypothetical protein